MSDKMTPVRVTLRKEAVKRFMAGEYESLPQLAEDLNVNYNTMRDWLYKKNSKGISVKDQKHELDAEIKREAVRKSVKDLSKILKKSSGVMNDLLDRIKDAIERGVYDERDYVDLFAKIGGSLKNVHSTIRLEEGQSTANYAVQGGDIDLTKVKEALDAINNDPFSAFTEEIEVKDNK